MKPLPRSFFNRPTLQVAKELLGKVLVIGNCSGRINEVEAYIGKDDPACHACSGETPRNRPMFGQAGHLYVYFTYGMYHCANIVTERKGFPAAVLIRSVEPIDGIELMKTRRADFLKRKTWHGKESHLADGPGKLCIALGMTKHSHNSADLCKSSDCAVFDDDFKPKKIQKSPRIGIREGTDKLWRFYYQ